VKYWEIIADNLSKAGWSLGWVSALDLEGRTIWIVDAHGYGKRFVVRVDEKLTGFRELESAIYAIGSRISKCATYWLPMMAFATSSRSFFRSSSVSFSGSRTTPNFLSVPVNS